jgi:hypothetical protein
VHRCGAGTAAAETRRVSRPGDELEPVAAVYRPSPFDNAAGLIAGRSAQQQKWMTDAHLEELGLGRCRHRRFDAVRDRRHPTVAYNEPFSASRASSRGSEPGKCATSIASGSPSTRRSRVKR